MLGDALFVIPERDCERVNKVDTSRKIVHIDMDAFFASVEQRDNPEYCGLPLVVGGNCARGVVAAASYEARQFGIRSAMAMQKALAKCPSLVVLPPRMETYKAVSLQIREIFQEYTDLVELLSLDEAFLDVTHNKKAIPSASWVAQQIRATIHERTGLTASAGVSFNKFLAKVASGMNKPNGFTLISPEQAPDFIAVLPIEKFFGVGKATADKMHRMGIATGADLLRYSLEELESAFGKAGRTYFHIARNNDLRPVNPDRERHSVGTEDTFEQDVRDRREISNRMAAIAHEVVRRMERSQFVGRTLTLKVKFADFRQITRSRTMDYPIREVDDIVAIAQQMFAGVTIPPKGVRLVGMTVSNVCRPGWTGWRQPMLPFFSECEPWTNT
ncbi:MAG: DNA polymerase IV [Magnetococcales bacterium]|nr:DNA polymerase IV [Magnetococcales bacterium]